MYGQDEDAPVQRLSGNPNSRDVTKLMTPMRENYRMVPATIIGRRCPSCGRGAMFHGLFAMNERCPECGLLFGRGQPGYFTGAMYVSYALSIPLITLITLVEYQVLADGSLWQLVLLAWVFCLPLTPWIWQYSRTIWVHFDQWVDSDGDIGAGSDTGASA